VLLVLHAYPIVDVLDNPVSSSIFTVTVCDFWYVVFFIELASELSHLSESLGNLEDFTEALNGKITETLGKLAEKLEFAANTIKESDKAQDKRQKLIDKGRFAASYGTDDPYINITAASFCYILIYRVFYHTVLRKKFFI
jgi:hypothetical protein